MVGETCDLGQDQRSGRVAVEREPQVVTSV
jgi:hypothetical protein